MEVLQLGRDADAKTRAACDLLLGKLGQMGGKVDLFARLLEA